MLDIYYGEMKFDTVSTSPNYEWINFFSELIIIIYYNYLDYYNYVVQAFIINRA